MKNFFNLLIFGVALAITPQVGRCGPPGSEGPVFTDPKAQKEYEQWQAKMKAGPYFKQVSRALPTNSELSGYSVKREIGNFGSDIKAIRQRDKAELFIGVLSSSNAEIMKYHSDDIWSGDAAGRAAYSHSSPSGKPLGQSSIQHIDSENNARYLLQVIDGPTQLNFWMTAKLNSDPKSQYPTWKPITKADQLFLEHLARIMLRRLKALKLTHDTYKPK